MKTVTITLEATVPDNLAKKLKEKGIYIKPVEFLVSIEKDKYSKKILFRPVGARVEER